jgi:flagellar biosynthesis anti-sigma factor FlgM
MKINGIQRPPVDVTPGVRRAVPHRGASPAARVAVSHEAKQLAEARAPAVSDAAKVARLAAAIARGDFMIDADRVVERMLGEER